MSDTVRSENKMRANTIITGGRLNGPTEENQHADGQPLRCLEESATLLHGGLDTSRQVTRKKQTGSKVILFAKERKK
jgi:hypothetical protein